MKSCEPRTPATEPPPDPATIEYKWDGKQQGNLRADDKHGETQPGKRIFFPKHAIEPEHAAKQEQRRILALEHADKGRVEEHERRDE